MKIALAGWGAGTNTKPHKSPRIWSLYDAQEIAIKFHKGIIDLLSQDPNSSAREDEQKTAKEGKNM